MGLNKVTILAILGTALEVYDFLIYSLLASYLTKVFFISSSSSIAFIETFIIFSVGYLIRPIGGSIIGSFGDRFGRKKSFLLSIHIMAISTLLISLLPSYHSIGIISPLLLMVFRIFQGIAHGAELPGAITFMIEFSKSNRKGYSTGLVFFATGLGGVLSTGIIYLLTNNFDRDQIIDFYWRVPFLIGGLLSLIGIYFRRNAKETPSFCNILKKETTPFKTLVLQNTSLIYKGFNVALLPTLLIILGHYLPAYFSEFQEFKEQQIHLAMLCGMIGFTLFIPIFGILSDMFEKNYFLLFVAIITLCLAASLFLKEAIHSVLIFILVYKLISAAFVACFPSILADLFPAKIRFSGVAFCYNMAFVASAFLLFISTSLSKIYHTSSSMMILVISVATYFIFTQFFNFCRNNRGFDKCL